MNTGVRTVEELAAALRDAEEELHRSQKQTQEALERQTATAEILKVIASSPSDVQPVFDAIAESAHRLFKGRAATVTRVVGDEIRLAAFTSTGEEGNRALRDLFPRSASSAASNHAMVVRTGKHSQVADHETDPDISPERRVTARARGFRSQLVVPIRAPHNFEGLFSPLLFPQPPP